MSNYQVILDIDVELFFLIKKHSKEIRGNGESEEINY
jgi:hypothetical protein